MCFDASEMPLIQKIMEYGHAVTNPAYLGPMYVHTCVQDTVLVSQFLEDDVFVKSTGKHVSF